MSQTKEIKVLCDPATGLCTAQGGDEKVSESTIEWNTHEELIYVGDPMCSWCWGISPQLHALRRFGMQSSIPFTMMMGGLRPGGGDEWNAEFTGFLRHHWEEVTKRSGQPFGYALLEQEFFDYDTEPACRAVITARHMNESLSLQFYELVQHSFYVKSNDPKEVEFYHTICDKLGLDFNDFSQRFSSTEMKEATRRDFSQSKQMGITGFPAVVYRNGDKYYFIARGYSDFETMKGILESIKNEE